MTACASATARDGHAAAPTTPEISKNAVIAMTSHATDLIQEAPIMPDHIRVIDQANNGAISLLFMTYGAISRRNLAVVHEARNGNGLSEAGTLTLPQ